MKLPNWVTKSLRARRSIRMPANHPSVATILGRLTSGRQPTNHQPPQAYGQKLPKKDT